MKKFSRLRVCVIWGGGVESSTGFLTQSKYYSPSLNAAIFDGPIKIYFAQHQEELALELYSHLQKNIQKKLRSSTLGATNIYLMMYPNNESFEMSFDLQADPQTDHFMAQEMFGEDYVLGIRGPIGANEYEALYKNVESIFSQKNPEILEVIQGA